MKKTIFSLFRDSTLHSEGVGNHKKGGKNTKQKRAQSNRGKEE